MSRPSLRNAGSSLPLLGLLSVLGLTIYADTAAAQQPIPPFEIQKIIRAPGQPSAADQAKIDSFLKSEIFAHFVNPAAAAKLPGVRKGFGNLVKNVDKTPGHDFLNSLAFKYAGMIISPKATRFGPVSKYNALLLLADLNENDAANKLKPYPGSLNVLMYVISLPPDNSLAYLKPAGLIGITRFAQERAIPQDKVPKVTEILLELLNNADAPAGTSGSAHNFIRRGAARALAAMGSPGPDNGVLKAFETIVADPNSRLTLRCEIAQFIGELNIPTDTKFDLKSLANDIGLQTVEICEQELERASSEKRPPSRRILMYALDSGYTGLGGLARAAEKNPETSKFISGVRNKTSSTSALYKILDNVESTPDDQIAEKVTPEIEGIKGLLDARTAAAPVVAAAPQAPESQPQRPAN
jgi:hypothetical protein